MLKFPGTLATAGELLVKKAREGVRICMLVWDDKSSFNSKMMGGSGMMATHDEDTRRYFANTGVRPSLVSQPDILVVGVRKSSCNLFRLLIAAVHLSDSS